VRSAAAYASLATTLVLVLAQPRVVSRARIGPALAAGIGVALMAIFGIIGPPDLVNAARVLWRPLATIASIMATTSLAHRAGIFNRLARRVEIQTRGPVSRAFTAVYVVSALTSAVFNNDAAILLLTPLIVPLILRLYPLRQYLVVPFSFAVFMAAGVAPLCTSNPMNLVVAERAGIGFNEYALRMIPVALAGSVASYIALRLVFRRELSDDIPARGPEKGSMPPMEPGPIQLLVVIALMLCSYPVISYLDGPVWVVATVGALLMVLLCWRHDVATPSDAARGVAWDILAFLFCVFVIGTGLQNVGIIDRLAALYASAGSAQSSQIATVGIASAVGSAVVNNHPMAILNALAISTLPGDGRIRVLAALVGGDLGPRLLPMGSLAGLLWLDMLRRARVEVTIGQFVRVGALVTLPSLLVALVVLYLGGLV